jgi:putative exosortase-associated protein (TIGR04073 family)
MKKTIVFFAILCLMASIAYANDSLVEKMNSNKALTKFSRGVTNVVSSPGEYATQTPAAMEQSPDYLTGFLVTLGRGTGYMLLRAASGIYDIATCPFPGKTNYGPIMQPETIFEKAADSVTK